MSEIFVLFFELLVEGDDGFKKGWLESLWGNFHFFTLILAFIGQFVRFVLGFKTYRLSILKKCL